jgi:hypothetical protein
MANKLQAQNMAQRNAATGGAFGQTMQQEGSNILGMEKGQIPADVAAGMQRQIAQQVGSGVLQAPQGQQGLPGYGAGQSQDALARSLGMNSYQIMQQGMQMAPNWRSNVQSFMYTPQQAMQGFYLPQAQLGAQMAANQYQSEASKAMAAAQPNPQTVGQINTQIFQAQQDARTAQLAGQAVSGLATGYSNYMNPTQSTAYNPKTGVANMNYKGGPYDPNTGALRSGLGYDESGNVIQLGNQSQV